MTNTEIVSDLMTKHFRHLGMYKALNNIAKNHKRTLIGWFILLFCAGIPCLKWQIAESDYGWAMGIIACLHVLAALLITLDRWAFVLPNKKKVYLEASAERIRWGNSLIFKQDYHIIMDEIGFGWAK